MENSKEPGKKKIKDEDLNTVSGGCGRDPKKDERYRSKMSCSSCYITDIWEGDWGPRGVYYTCPFCNQQSMHCTSVKKII